MQKNLRDGLILRSLSEGHASDHDNLVAFYKEIFGVYPDDGWSETDSTWATRLLSGDHPTVSHDDVWVVVDPAKDDKIVSTTLLIPQVWRYEDIEIPTGRPEVVATHPDYRNRGLVRALFEVCHERSAALGHKLLAITGIPYYYRRFGYTMAVDLGDSGYVPLSAVPKLKDGETAQFTLRMATAADYPKLNAWDKYLAPQLTLSAVHDDQFWAWPTNDHGPVLQVIVNARGQDVGYLAVFHNSPKEEGDKWLFCENYVVGPESSYVETYSDVLRGLKAYAENTFAEGDLPTTITFAAAQPTALATLLERSRNSRVNTKPYAWYLRVPDLPDFLMHIKPVLERRLLHSGAHRYTGMLKINRYNQGFLQIDFLDGCIEKVELIENAPVEEEHDAGFPEDYFLHLVFGYCNWEDLRIAMTECWANGKAAVIFDAMFPKKPSRIFPIG